MASGSESYGGGSKGSSIGKMTAAKGRTPSYTAWHAGMDTPF